MRRLNPWDALDFPSVTLTVKVDVPSEGGVPLIWPDELFSVSPAGSVPDEIDHV